VKILTYNILNGGGRRLGEIAEVIRGQGPDVVALQEATSRWRAQVLARKLGMRMVFARANNSFHVAWLSKLPVLGSQNHRLPGLAKTLLEIQVEFEGSPLRLFTTHLAGGAEVIHPSEEIPVLLEVLRPLTGEPHLLAGDLNSVHPDDAVGPPPAGREDMAVEVEVDPRRAIRTMLESGYTDCFRVLHPDEMGYSYPSEHPWLRLDYLFASPELAKRLSASGLVDDEVARRASDHLPVWAVFH
jgi:endonuclease/exonuclease/phosphatase family metal-dependent hydrolase